MRKSLFQVVSLLRPGMVNLARLMVVSFFRLRVVNFTGFSTSTGGANHMNLVLKGNNIILSDGSTTVGTFVQDGACTFNRAKLLQNRKIFLKYSFTDANGFIYHCTDTLTFRNRIRDGINEWQDENPSHYN